MFNNINNSVSGIVSGLTGGYTPTPLTTQLPTGSQNNGVISAADTYPAPSATTSGAVDTNPYDNMSMAPVVPTTPTVPVPTGPVLSSTGPRQEFNSYQSKLDALLNQPDPFTPMYEQLQALNQTTQDNAIASATTASARQKFQEEQSGQQYQAGLATAGQQTGSSRYLPEYQLGLMKSARDATNDRIMQLDQTEKMAIAKAQQARIEGDVAVLKEQLNQVNELRKEKIRSLERAQDLDWEMKKFQQQMAFDREKFSYQKTKDAAGDDKENFYADAIYSINQRGGKLTPEIFKSLVGKGIASGEDRLNLIESFASYIPDIYKRDKKNAKAIKEQYGITDVEYAKVFTK